VESNVSTNIVLLFGRKGTGKTTWLRNAIEKIRGKKTILIIDTMNNFSDMSDREFRTHVEFIDCLAFCEYRNKTIRILSSEPTELIPIIFSAYKTGNFTIVFDEGDLLFGQHYDSYLREIVLRGRNQGIDLLIATLRPHKLSVDLRSQTDILVCFSLKNRRDLNAIRDEFSGDEILNIIENLQGHEYVRYDVNSGDFCHYTGKRSYIKSGKFVGKSARQIANRKMREEKGNGTDRLEGHNGLGENLGPGARGDMAS
jgi:hypothetical protein